MPAKALLSRAKRPILGGFFSLRIMVLAAPPTSMALRSIRSRAALGDRGARDRVWGMSQMQVLWLEMAVQ